VPRSCNHPGIINRGTIEPPIADSSNTANVLTAFICVCVLHSEARRRASPDAKTEAPRQATPIGRYVPIIGTSKNITATAQMIAACKNPISVKKTNFPHNIQMAPTGPTMRRSLNPFRRSSIEIEAPCMAEKSRNKIAVAPI